MTNHEIIKSLQLLDVMMGSGDFYLSPPVGTTTTVVEMYNTDGQWRVNTKDMVTSETGLVTVFDLDEIPVLIPYVENRGANMTVLCIEIESRLAGLAHHAYIDGDMLKFKTIKSRIGASAIDTYTKNLQLFSDSMMDALEGLISKGDLSAPRPKRSHLRLVKN